jgi:hypothetical protein
MSTEKIAALNSHGNIAAARESNRAIVFLVLKSTVRLTHRKTFIRAALFISMAFVIFIAASFVSRTVYFDATILPLPESKVPEIDPEDYVRCESVVFAVSANGDVYSGKHVIGNLTNISELIPRLKQELDSQAAGPAYSPGMNINVELPRRCADKSVYLKTARDANQSGILSLISTLHDARINPIWVFEKNKRVNQ